MSSQHTPMTDEQLDEMCHSLSVSDLSRYRTHIENYFKKLYGFEQRWRDKRTPEWIEKASRRYDGQTEPCCECGEPYPRADLALRSEIYCPGCREEARQRAEKWAK